MKTIGWDGNRFLFPWIGAVALLGVFLSLLLSASSSPCAIRDGRNDEDLRSTFASISDTGLLTWGDGTTSVQTGLVATGAIDGLADNQPDGTDVLVAGLNSFGALLEHWKKNPQTQAYELQSQFSSTGADFVGVGYDDGLNRIYLLDATQKVILSNSWNGTALLPTTNWNVWATSAQEPRLSDAGEMRLAATKGTNGEPAVLLQYELTKESEGVESYLLFESGGSIQSVVWMPWGSVVDIVADAWGASEAGTAVPVDAPEGSEVELVDMATDTVLGTALVPPGQNRVTVALSSGLAIGGHYVARRKGVSTNPELNFRCMRRYGFPEPFADGTELERVPHPHSNHIGNTDFWVVIGLDKDATLATPTAVTGNLAFAMRDPATGLDPVMQIGTNMVLSPSAFFAVEGTLYENGRGHAHASINIPEDPALVGQVMLFQFWLNDGSQIRVSEVVGIIIDTLPPVGPSSSSRSASSGAGSFTVTERNAAFQIWTRKLLQSKKAFRGTALIQELARQRAKK